MKDWSDAELAAAVEAYKEMMTCHDQGRPYNKREIYRALSKRFERTEKAFEYRMQNISAVLAEMGKEWLPGLKPAANVGANVGDRIRMLLERRESVAKQVPQATTQSATAPSRKTSQTKVFDRDPEVVRDAKRRAGDGRCEACGELGFETDAGYYLEVHHVVPLNCGGPDAIWNVVAICSNDHRRAHFAKDRAAVRDHLIGMLGRLYPDRLHELQAFAHRMDTLPNIAEQLESDPNS
ncbi:HNH endonuclease signature motif containing protein [Cupriavidus taiwanensis]|uniref:HNH endonuclease signature motif containing protein n=1 Tax=Cupriavidus taiwanensis TaxID=164546 RepID=UPI00253F724A|nr:HNH endonuclease signature motif containing protein [Cupriavidus taiwanensis]MDK3021613.1 HNH endonuclease signature motif containing protein [Cupriavidus taiwanensis]